MGLFGRSDERIALQNVIANLRHEIGLTDSAIKQNLIEANRLRVASPSFPKWEYLVVEDVDEATLDSRGQSGWELVSAVSYSTGFGIGGNSSYKVHIRYIFKRSLGGTFPEEAASYLNNIEGHVVAREQLEHQLASAEAQLQAM